MRRDKKVLTTFDLSVDGDLPAVSAKQSKQVVLCIPPEYFETRVPSCAHSLEKVLRGGLASTLGNTAAAPVSPVRQLQPSATIPSPLSPSLLDADADGEPEDLDV